jgi:hypothetical protein
MPRKIAIIFSTLMVRALLEGRKTMTRRLACNDRGAKTVWQWTQAGDKLWVRERFNFALDGSVRYMADDPAPAEHLWAPPIHMAREHSRLVLIVTAIRTEPLHSISDEDCIAEGVENRAAFIELWSLLHHKFWSVWDKNPLVVPITFTVEKRNIDQPGEHEYEKRNI